MYASNSDIFPGNERNQDETHNHQYITKAWNFASYCPSQSSFASPCLVLTLERRDGGDDCGLPASILRHLVAVVDVLGQVGDLLLIQKFRVGALGADHHGQVAVHDNVCVSKGRMGSDGGKGKEEDFL